MQSLRWDIFCRVIDNFGDIGVCWRLASSLAQRGQQVRLWVDDASALAWMAPGGHPSTQGGVQVMAWQPDAPMPADAKPGDVVIEAFGCEIDQAWIATNSVATLADSMPAIGQKGLEKPIWINLEYLSAESYVVRSHGLRSPVLAGPAQGLEKWFFYPGFTAGTGGLICDKTAPAEPVTAQAEPSAQRISLFCYEPEALPQLLTQLAASTQRSELLVMQGRAQHAVDAAFKKISHSENGLSPAWNQRRMLLIREQTLVSQIQYDALLQSCDLNFVRGEDSLARALLAGRAFVWQIYPQDDGAHAAKLEAFLDWLQAPPDWREFHRVWNGLSPAPLPPLNIPSWTRCAQAAQAKLLAQTDLITQLLDFVEEKQKAAA